MKDQYKFAQTVVHKDLHGKATATTAVKHDYEGAVPMTEAARLGAYLRQNGRSDTGATGGYYEDFGRQLTARQQRQLRRQLRRSTMRAARHLSPVARDMAIGRPRVA